MAERHQSARRREGSSLQIHGSHLAVPTWLHNRTTRYLRLQLECRRRRLKKCTCRSTLPRGKLTSRGLGLSRRPAALPPRSAPAPRRPRSAAHDHPLSSHIILPTPGPPAPDSPLFRGNGHVPNAAKLLQLLDKFIALRSASCLDRGDWEGVLDECFSYYLPCTGECD